MIAGNEFDLTLWTNVPAVASLADATGINRIGLDIETLHKSKRQAGKKSWISPHKEKEITTIKNTLKNAELFVRCNPFGGHTQDEIKRLIDYEVQIIMVPNFTTASEIEKIVEFIGGHAKCIPLIERLAAVKIINDLMKNTPISEYHIGLNDLSYDLNYSNRFKLLNHPMLESLCRKITNNGLKLGIGGVAKPMDSTTPIPSDLIYARIAALGATGTLIARSFEIDKLDSNQLEKEIRHARSRIQYWRNCSPKEIEAAKIQMKDSVEHISL